MTPSEWRQFLERYSHELLRTDDPRIEIPPAARAANWMGFHPVSESAIRAAEERLRLALPQSLRNFYLVTNGWRATGFSIRDVLPVQEIAWLIERDPHLHRGACQCASALGPFKRDPDGARLREYQHEQGTRVKRSLVISSWGDAALWLLDPGDPPHAGEWAAGRWASWNPGMEWQAENFAEMMRRELASLVRLRDL